MSQLCALVTKKTNGILGGTRNIASRLREVILLPSTSDATPDRLCPSLGSLVWEKCGHAGDIPGMDHENDQGSTADLLWQKTEAARPRNEKSWGDLIKIYPKWRYKKGVARLFPVVTSGRNRGSRHTMNHRRIYLNNRKPFFSVRVNKQWQSLFREVIGSPSIELLKKLSVQGSG